MRPNFDGSRVQRIRREVRIRDLLVQRVERLSPNFVSVTLSGPELADFQSDAFDDHVKLMIPDAAGGVSRRDYTPRHFDRVAQTLTIEFALHPHGPASDWARQAAPGQRLTVGGPRGSMLVPDDVDWHLLIGDASALPAIHRRLEELAPGARATALVLVDDDADRRDIRSLATLDLQWFTHADALLAALQHLSWPAGDGYVWAGGESSLMNEVRREVLERRAHPPRAARISSYWKRGVADHHERLHAA